MRFLLSWVQLAIVLALYDIALMFNYDLQLSSILLLRLCLLFNVNAMLSSQADLLH